MRVSKGRGVWFALLAAVTFATVFPLGAMGAEDSPAEAGTRAAAIDGPEATPCDDRDQGDLCMTVNAGEGLWGVARRYQQFSCLSTTPGAVKARARAIYRRNRRAIGRNPNRVRVDQVLRVGRYTTVTIDGGQFWHDPAGRCPGAP